MNLVTMKDYIYATPAKVLENVKNAEMLVKPIVDLYIKKNYKNFMQKLGNGGNIEEILDKHIEKINKTITKNEEIEKFCKSLDTDIKRCVQKVRNI